MLRIHWRPSMTAYAASPEEKTAAPRDAGWAELLSADGETSYGRGHLMLLATESRDLNGDRGSDVDTESAQPVGKDGPELRAELSSFTFEQDPPEVGAQLLVRPEREQASYSVLVREIVDTDEKRGTLLLDWPDDRLPASLSELGGA